MTRTITPRLPSVAYTPKRDSIFVLNCHGDPTDPVNRLAAPLRLPGVGRYASYMLPLLDMAYAKGIRRFMFNQLRGHARIETPGDVSALTLNQHLDPTSPELHMLRAAISEWRNHHEACEFMAYIGIFYDYSSTAVALKEGEARPLSNYYWRLVEVVKVWRSLFVTRLVLDYAGNPDHYHRAMFIRGSFDIKELDITIEPYPFVWDGDNKKAIIDGPKRNEFPSFADLRFFRNHALPDVYCPPFCEIGIGLQSPMNDDDAAFVRSLIDRGFGPLYIYHPSWLEFD